MKKKTDNKNLSVFKQYYCPWKYPSNWIRNVRLFFRQFKWAYQRATKGYCDCDWWDADTHLTQLFADMLMEFVKHGNSYPGTDEFPTFESWADYLRETADLFYYSLDELPNEYEKDWLKQYEGKTAEEFFIGVEKTPEEKEVTNKFLDKEFENEQLKEEALRKGLNRLVHVFNTLWD